MNLVATGLAAVLATSDAVFPPRAHAADAEHVTVTAPDAMDDPAADAAVLKAPDEASAAEDEDEDEYEYEPPRRGVPRNVEGAGTRGLDDPRSIRYRAPTAGSTSSAEAPGEPEWRRDAEVPSRDGVHPAYLAVLAPDHVGLTTASSPTLYWYVSEAPGARVVLTLTGDAPEAIVIDIPLAPPSATGIQSISLRELGVSLDAEREYRWSVSVLTSAGHEARETVTARIKHVAAPAIHVGGARTTLETARAYAEAGYWYDALDVLGRGMQNRDDAALTLARASLLDQIGLLKVSGSEKAAVASGLHD